LSVELKQILIAALHRFQSKKFLVWAIASIALFTNYIDAEAWLMISGGYLGVQSFLDWKTPTGKPPQLVNSNEVPIPVETDEQPTEEPEPPTPETVSISHAPIKRHIPPPLR